MLRRTWAEVSAEALAENYRTVRSVVSDGCAIMATVKADAYGHGAVPSARAFAAAGADWFSVSNLCEAIELREAGLRQPILLLGYTPPEEAMVLARLCITQTVSDGDYAAALEAAAAAADVTVGVHIKLDTGMSRLGFWYQNENADVEAIAEACALPHLNVGGIFTHLADADNEDASFSRRQFALFQHAIARLGERGITFALKHCCNSAATMRFPEYHLDMVRPGLVLYGYAPLGEPGLRPAMALKTVVAQVKTVPAGTPVSYGCTAVTERETVLATVPIGYADGLPRSCSDRGVMLVNGQRARIVGRVCMDQCMLDVTGLTVAAGDEVTVFDESLPATELAALSDTIVYEILCSVGKRVPRAYV